MIFLYFIGWFFHWVLFFVLRLNYHYRKQRREKNHLLADISLSLCRRKKILNSLVWYCAVYRVYFNLFLFHRDRGKKQQEGEYDNLHRYHRSSSALSWVTDQIGVFSQPLSASFPRYKIVVIRLLPVWVSLRCAWCCILSLSVWAAPQLALPYIAWVEAGWGGDW